MTWRNVLLLGLLSLSIIALSVAVAGSARAPGWPFLPFPGRLAQQPRFRAAAAACERALEPAARRVEAVLGVPVDARGYTYRFAEGDGHWRARTAMGGAGMRPVIRLDAAVLASGSATPEELMAHELTHAALLTALGPAHGSLPAWLREGLAVHAAGQTQSKLAAAMNWAPESIRHDLAARFDGPDHAGADLGVDAVAIEVLVARAGDDAVLRLVAALRAGGSWDSALRGLTGLDRASFGEAVREQAALEIASLLAPHAGRLREARATTDPGVALAALGPLLADHAHALWPAAVIVASPHLVASGRAADASALLDDLLDSRRVGVERIDLALAASFDARRATGDGVGARRRCVELRELSEASASTCGCEGRGAARDAASALALLSAGTGFP